MKSQPPNKPFPPKVLKQLREFGTADTAQMPENRNLATISPYAYPPYPRTKTAYYNIMQDAINIANARGYDSGVAHSRERHREDIHNKLLEALCKASTALAERKY